MWACARALPSFSCVLLLGSLFCGWCPCSFGSFFLSHCVCFLWEPKNRARDRSADAPFLSGFELLPSSCDLLTNTHIKETHTQRPPASLPVAPLDVVLFLCATLFFFLSSIDFQRHLIFFSWRALLFFHTKFFSLSLPFDIVPALSPISWRPCAARRTSFTCRAWPCEWGEKKEGSKSTGTDQIRSPTGSVCVFLCMSFSLLLAVYLLFSVFFFAPINESRRCGASPSACPVHPSVCRFFFFLFECFKRVCKLGAVRPQSTRRLGCAHCQRALPSFFFLPPSLAR